MKFLQFKKFYSFDFPENFQGHFVTVVSLLEVPGIGFVELGIYIGCLEIDMTSLSRD